MGNTNGPLMNSLNEFEYWRNEKNLIPNQGETFFFNVGKGRITLHGIRNIEHNYRFNIQIQRGRVYTGYGNFEITGDHTNADRPYNSMIVGAQGELIVSDKLTIDSENINNPATVTVIGSMELSNGSNEYPTQLNMHNNARLTMDPHSTLTIGEYVKINIDSGAEFHIYGTINIHISSIDDLLDSDNIYIDSAAILNVSGLSNGNKTFSLTDYDTELRTSFVQRHVRGARDVGDLGRVGFNWVMGDPMQPSHVLGITMFIGELPLGDFKLSFLGMPNRTIGNMQSLSDFLIDRRATLHICDEFMGYKYYFPELYIGVMIGNNRIPARCNVEGNIIVNGKYSRITIDRGGQLIIAEGGSITLTNGGSIHCTHNIDDTGDEEVGIPVLIINGTLIVDDISQLVTRGLSQWRPENIIFGPNGKIVVKNTNNTNQRRIILQTPNHIKDSYLYYLFHDNNPSRSRIRNVVFHIPKDCGIKVDHHNDNHVIFVSQMRDWYGGLRFERAVKDGLLVWEEGAYLELDNQYISWIDENSNLFVIGYIFKAFGVFRANRLQDAVNRLRYAGCGSMIIRFVNGGASRELTLDLTHCFKRSTFFRPRLRPPLGDGSDDGDWNTKDHFVLYTDNDGELFIRNRVPSAQVSQILDERSHIEPLPTTRTAFVLPPPELTLS